VAIEEVHMTRLNGWTKALLAILIIGAINWGLIGFFNWNLVDAILGGGAREETSAASRVVYALVGLSGLFALARMLVKHPEPKDRQRFAPGRPVAQ
jgi:uncharacterized membrane protein YuzA (DUF378 family)